MNETKEVIEEKKENEVLMHTCCAPCSVSCIEMLREEKYEPVLFWYNPNIHPYTEYQKRLDSLWEYSMNIGVELIVKDEYKLKEFVEEAIKDIENRCIDVCYKMRLEATAASAVELGYKKFTTTLLVSPYQDTEMLIEIGKELAEEYKLEFVVLDFKSRFREGQTKAKDLGLYMQKYCGCIFSEAERYKRNTWTIKTNNKAKNIKEEKDKEKIKEELVKEKAKE